MHRIKENTMLLLGILLCVSTLTVFGPMELYFTNYGEFWFAWADVLTISAIGAGLCMVVLVVPGIFLKKTGRDLYGYLLSVVGLALYLQGNYANINYGVLDGKAVDWSAYLVYAVLDTAGWLVLIGGAVFLWLCKRTLVNRLQKYVVLFIVSVQILTLGTLFVTEREAVTEKSDYYLSDEGMFGVSSDENIIIFVLDAFDGTYFQEILQEEPEKYQEVFRDFTCFNNASVGGARTKIGMPAIITGEPYPGKISYTEYVEQAFDHDGLYSAMQRENYDVRFYTNSVFIPDGVEGLVDNQVSTGYQVSSYTGLANRYFSLTLYKYMPHLLKRFFWIYTGDFDQYRSGVSAEAYVIDDAAYYERLQREGLGILNGKKVFRLFHLNGAHPPYCIDEQAQRISSGNGTIIRQAKGALHIVEDYISKLKELGCYESSTILVMADHGDTYNAAHGILLMKGRGSSSAFKETPSPVSYYDLHATLFRELGKPGDPTFFDISEKVSRQRYFYLNSMDSGNLKVIEYKIPGDVRDEVSWQETGNILTPGIEEDRLYQYGTVLKFGVESTAVKYITEGISSRDAGDYSWTDGKEAEFLFEFAEETEKDLQVMLDVMAVYDENGPQNLIIYANDTECYRDILIEGKRLQFEIPNEVVRESWELSLRLELPNAVIPVELFGEGNDPRELAIAITGLQIGESEKETDNLASLSAYTFGENGNSLPYLLEGWYEPEQGRNWGNDYAELFIKTQQICEYELTINYSVYEYSGETAVYLNGSPLAVLAGNKSSVAVLIPKDLLNTDGDQVLAFETPGAVSPSKAEGSGDERKLGICLYSMSVLEKLDVVR